MNVQASSIHITLNEMLNIGPELFVMSQILRIGLHLKSRWISSEYENSLLVSNCAQSVIILHSDAQIFKCRREAHFWLEGDLIVFIMKRDERSNCI